MENATMKTSILGALAVGALVGFWVGPRLAVAGITMFGPYMTLVVVLLVCNLVTSCRN